MLYQSTYYSHVANLLCSIKLKIAHDFLLHTLQHDRCVYICRLRVNVIVVGLRSYFLRLKKLSAAADEGWQGRMCLPAYVQSSCITVPDSKTTYYAGIIP